MSTPLLTVENLSVSYADRVALDGVSLSLYPGEVVSFVGPNGAGKSTLLKSIAGHMRPGSGAIRHSAALHDAGQSLIGYVPQRGDIDWTMPASVMDLVLMGSYRMASRWRSIGRGREEAALRALDVVGMRQHAKTQIGRLSGGQQQRIILARTLIRPAMLYLLDEPFTGVDAPTEAIFEQVIQDLRAKGKCVAMATHNLECAREISDRVLVLNRKIIALGHPNEALTPLTIAVAYGDMSQLKIHGDTAHIYG